MYFCRDDSPMQSYRSMLRETLIRAPRMQQLAVRDGTIKQPSSHHISPPASMRPYHLSSLVYLEFIDGLLLADWTYLLTAAAPPVFAAQLTHLALRVHWRNRAAAAALLPSLPSLYPSLTHVHIGVQDRWSSGPPTVSAEWDAALRAVRAAVGSAWCESVHNVVACREDIVWLRSAGLSMQVPQLEWLDWIGH